MQLAEFLSLHATALTTRILAQFTPRYTPTAAARQQLAIAGWKRPFVRSSTRYRRGGDLCVAHDVHVGSGR
jgi:hypothetical protein